MYFGNFLGQTYVQPRRGKTLAENFSNMWLNLFRKKNERSSHHPRFGFTPKTGIAFPKTGILFLLSDPSLSRTLKK